MKIINRSLLFFFGCSILCIHYSYNTSCFGLTSLQILQPRWPAAAISDSAQLPLPASSLPGQSLRCRQLGALCSLRPFQTGSCPQKDRGRPLCVHPSLTPAAGGIPAQDQDVHRGDSHFPTLLPCFCLHPCPRNYRGNGRRHEAEAKKVPELERARRR